MDRLEKAMTEKLQTGGPADFWAIAPEHAEHVFGNLRHERDRRAGADASAENAPDNSPLAISKMITRNENGVAVITVSAPLESDTWLGWFSGSILALGHGAIRQAVSAALADRDIRAILLSFDSPGGVVQGTKELADFLAEAGKSKPIAAYANGLCASAAFWLAASTGRIYAPATALVGSIGVIMCVEDYSGVYEKMGLRVEYIASGKFKAAGRSGKKLSEEERAYFQDQLGRLHEIFKADVRSRLDIKAADPDWAEAQLMVAAQAEALGLVSGIVRDEKEVIKILVEETLMPKITRELLAKEEPELLADIEQAAIQDQAAKIATARQEAEARTLAIVETACGKDTADKVRALVATGMSPDQLAAAATIFGGASGEKKALSGEAAKREEMLNAIKQATPGAVRDGASLNPEDEAQAAIQRIGKM